MYFLIDNAPDKQSPSQEAEIDKIQKENEDLTDANQELEGQIEELKQTEELLRSRIAELEQSEGECNKECRKCHTLKGKYPLYLITSFMSSNTLRRGN